MYELIREPESGELKRAFNALDEAFGAERFDKNSAKKVLAEHGFSKATFDNLIEGQYISEVD